MIFEIKIVPGCQLQTTKGQSVNLSDEYSILFNIFEYYFQLFENTLFTSNDFLPLRCQVYDNVFFFVSVSKKSISFFETFAQTQHLHFPNFELITLRVQELLILYDFEYIVEKLEVLDNMKLKNYISDIVFTEVVTYIAFESLQYLQCEF